MAAAGDTTSSGSAAPAAAPPVIHFMAAGDARAAPAVDAPSWSMPGLTREQVAEHIRNKFHPKGLSLAKGEIQVED